MAAAPLIRPIESGQFLVVVLCAIERETSILFRGYRYLTMQQPTKLCASMTRLGAIYSMFSSMVSRVRCLVWHATR